MIFLEAATSVAKGILHEGRGIMRDLRTSVGALRVRFAMWPRDY